jgi:TRAP-type C4-dicarboxylate transport system permease small subunit
LEGNIGELVDTLVRRQHRRYGPFTQAGVSLGAYAGVAAVSLAFAFFGVLLGTGVIPSAAASDPPNPGDGWAGAVFFLVMAAGFTVAAVRAVRRQLREHPAHLERNLGTISTQPHPSEAS